MSGFRGSGPLARAALTDCANDSAASGGRLLIHASWISRIRCVSAARRSRTCTEYFDIRSPRFARRPWALRRSPIGSRTSRAAPRSSTAPTGSTVSPVCVRSEARSVPGTRARSATREPHRTRRRRVHGTLFRRIAYRGSGWDWRCRSLRGLARRVRVRARGGRQPAGRATGDMLGEPRHHRGEAAPHTPPGDWLSRPRYPGEMAQGEHVTPGTWPRGARYPGNMARFS